MTIALIQFQTERFGNCNLDFSLASSEYHYLGKDPDAGKDGRQEKKQMTEDEMVGWHHWLNGYEFEQTLGDGGQGSLACCSLWACKEPDTAVWLKRERLPFSMSQVIDLQPWPGDQGCCGEELSFPAPQARRFLRPIDCPFIKDCSENEGKFPTYSKCLEIFFLTIILSSNLSLWLCWFTASWMEAKKVPYQPLETDVSLEISRRRWQTICAFPNNVVGN